VVLFKAEAVEEIQKCSEPKRSKMAANLHVNPFDGSFLGKCGFHFYNL
jgi:hypothetical protein